jgi:hypothetical protein
VATGAGEERGANGATCLLPPVIWLPARVIRIRRRWGE